MASGGQRPPDVPYSESILCVTCVGLLARCLVQPQVWFEFVVHKGQCASGALEISAKEGAGGLVRPGFGDGGGVM